MRSRYQIQQQVHRGPRSRVSRATHVSTGEQVILKQNATDVPISAAFARSQREFCIASPIQSEHVAHYLGVEREADSVAVIEEVFGDTSLAELLRYGSLPIDVALAVAVEVSAGLCDVHAHDVIHRAIHPGNVLVDTATWRAKIADFSEATLLQEVPEPTRRLDADAIPLPYISPEQTGRINRQVDYRTDFYSLGATLYHALAGHPPFELADPLSLVHAHIAIAPTRLSVVDASIPEQISRIVDKLLAKNAEDRYQSARGIMADLRECLAQYRRLQQVTEFPLGRSDVPEKFIIPQRLYGRAPERQALLDAFNAAARGQKLLFLVRGSSGIGKSSLVNETHKLVLERRGLFVSGKFDPLKGHAPYSVIAQALRQLCRGLLSLPEQDLVHWKADILERVSVNAGLIIDLAPELERVLGPQPPVPETGLTEAQHRFDLTLVRFLSAFASPAHPLVLFLDDLQRADPATLHALSEILRLPEPTHLLVIGAYRDNEVDANHPLTVTLTSLGNEGVEVQEVQLANLALEQVSALLADTLRRPPPELADLAEHVIGKTGGNPFFVHQLLQTLHDEKILRFSTELRAWTWERAALGAMNISANVVDLMLRKLSRLPSATNEALQIGACVGNLFDLETLCAATALSKEEMRARLAPAVREGLLVPLDPNYPLGLVDITEEQSASREPREHPDSSSEAEHVNYRYRLLHDRVQQAAYESVTESGRPEVHLRVGRILLARTSMDSRGALIFDIVDQLNRGAHLIREPDRRRELAELNLEAGKRARLGTAYHEALAYLERGLELLSTEAWSLDYDLSYALHLRYAECAYLTGRFDEARAFADALFSKLRTPIEKSELYAILIGLETNRGENARAIALGREALFALGHPLPQLKTTLPLVSLLAKVKLATVKRPIAKLVELPPLTDPVLVPVVNILNHLVQPALFTDPKLFAWIVNENLRIAIAHGFAPSAAFGFLNYGLFLVARKRDYAGALAIGQVALDLAARPDAFALRGRIYDAYAVSVNAYAENHVRTCIPLLKQAIELTLESGDLLYTSLASAAVPMIMLMAGMQLAEICDENELRQRSTCAFRYEDMTLAMRILGQCLRCLRGKTLGPTSFATDDLDEAALLAEVEARPDPLWRSLFFMWKIQVVALMGDHREALRLVLLYDDMIESSNRAWIWASEHLFFASLTLVAGLRDAADDSSLAAPTADCDTAALQRSLAQKLGLLAEWAASAPVNFRHKHALVSAELADLGARFEQAGLLYDEAVSEAAANGFPQHAALAAELAGRAYLRRGRTKIARAYLEDARAGYETWGALGKVRALDREFSELRGKAPTHAQTARTLDAVSVLRASQALSSEIALPTLLEHMMQMIVQTSGAQRGSLLVEQAGRLRMEAHLDVADRVVEVPAGAGADGHGFVSDAIVRYTLRTGEELVLADAARGGEFTRDPYVLTHGSRSILCMAVRHRDRVIAVLFLENELSADVFTEERLEVLRLLVAQAAISLENARLYDALRAREALLRDLFEGMPVGVYVVDAQGRTAFENRRAVEILGEELAPTAELRAAQRARSMRLAGTDDPYPVERLPLMRALRGETAMEDDMEVVRPDRRVPIAAWGTPIRGDDGGVRYAVVAFQDITQQRAMEADRTRLEAQLHQAERLESIGRLAGGVAHDFNNLLTPMQIYADLAADALPPQSPVRAQIEQIRRSAEHAAELTRQLLTFGRKQALEARELDLNQEVRGFERLFRRVVREDIELDLRLAPALRPVRADPSQIQRILMNLAMNAADAMPHGGRITIETCVAGDSPGSRDASEQEPRPPVALYVRDTGVGMDKDILEKIFDPFFSTKQPGKGSGLGLPTVHGLVSQHGGQLSVQSEPGRGTTFEILFPSIQGGNANAVGKAPEESELPVSRGETILLVEDDDAVRVALRQVLIGDGYRVVASGSPKEALKLARELGDQMDLVITDLVMPVMNGRELFAQLSRERPALPALFISGYAQDVLAAPSEVDAAVELLPKPLSTNTLRSKVREVLGHAAKGRT
ncbi:MAG: AAA family ATPase [Myxococcales bacterium]